MLQKFDLLLSKKLVFPQTVIIIVFLCSHVLINCLMSLNVTVFSDKAKCAADVFAMLTEVMMISP